MTLTQLRRPADTLVCFQLSVPGEPFVTGGAAEAFLLGVDRHVQRHSSFMGKPFVTERATERFLSCVNPHVQLQSSLLTETFATK